MRFSICKIDNNYVKKLNELDSRVQIHHGAFEKPYLGVVLRVNTIDYFVPLSSTKPKYDTMRESLTLVKVNDGKKNLAVLNMNNMIPVPQSCIIPFDFEEIQDKQYRNLLKKEFSICRNKKSSIQTKAQTVHQFVTLEPEKHQKMLAYCVDFKKLETFCLSYGEVSTKQVQTQNKFEARLAAAEAKKVKPEAQEHHFKHL